MMPRFTGFTPIVLILLLTSLPHLAYILSQWQHYPLHPDGTPMGPGDPDPWLRLTLVRDWLMGGDWYDHSVARSNAPLGGISSPWTRPLDLVIAALVYAQPETLAINMRLMHAALLLPWIFMTLLALGIYRLIKLTHPHPFTYLIAALLIATNPALWNYFGLGNADHHAALATLFIWTLGNLFAPSPSRLKLGIAGLLLGLQLWISVEALMLIGAIYIYFGLRWLRGEHDAPRALWVIAATTLLSATCAVAIERPPAAWLTPVYDSISIVYLVALFAALAVATALRYTTHDSLPRRMGLGAFYVASASAALYAAYPLFFAGPMAEVDGYIFSTFLPAISEAKPFYKVDLQVLLANALLVLPALWLCMAPWRRGPATPHVYSPNQAAPRLYFLLITLGLYAAQQRWSYYLLPLSIALVAPAIGTLFREGHPHARWRWRALIAATILPVITLATPHITQRLAPEFWQAHWPEALTELAKKKNTDLCQNNLRWLLRSGALDRITQTTPLTILAPTNLGAEILFFSNHRIIASNYHREGPGIRYVWEAEAITDAALLRRHLAERSVNLLLLCPSRRLDHESLFFKIRNDAFAPWLTSVPYDLPPQPDISADEHNIDSPPLLMRVE